MRVAGFPAISDNHRRYSEKYAGVF